MTFTYLKTKNISRNSTGTLKIDWNYGQAYSYRMCIARCIDSVWYVADTKYSVTTVNHERALRGTLPNTQTIRAPFGLQDMQYNIEYFDAEMQRLTEELKTRVTEPEKDVSLKLKN